MKKTLIVILLILLTIYLAIALFLFIKQRSFLYFPTPPIQHNFEREIFTNNSERINITVLNKGKEKAVMYFGGNGEAVDYNATRFSTLFPEHTVYLVNYRGYGGSTGKPTEQGLYSDALHIFDMIQARHKRVSVMGRSLGSGIATYVASQKTVNKLVLVTPFDSVKNVAQRTFKFFPMYILLKDKYNSVSRVEKITAETLVIAAEFDQLIPKQHTDSLVNAFPASQVLYISIKKANHNNISNSQAFYSSISQFINSQ